MAESFRVTGSAKIHLFQGDVDNGAGTERAGDFLSVKEVKNRTLLQGFLPGGPEKTLNLRSGILVLPFGQFLVKKYFSELSLLKR
jgi:hypothetical protein